MMGNGRDEWADEIQALQRQVEQLTVCLERQEAQSERSLNHACPGDEIDNVNPFNRQRVRDNTFMKRISRSSNAIIKS